MRTIIFVNDGVATVVTEDPEAEIVIIDYDSQFLLPADEVPEWDGDGDPCRIVNSEAEVNKELVEKHLGPGKHYPLSVRFGSAPELKDNIDRLSFESERSREAYLNGMSDMDGWLDYEILNQDEIDEECT